MSLNTALTLILGQYPSAMTMPLSGSSMAEFIRTDVPKAVEAVIGRSDRYIAQGSAGKGNWARVPWVAVFDRLITETAQDGYYLVYLVKEDFSGVYLSLNQGVTTIRAAYGADAKEALAVRAADYLARLGQRDRSMVVGPIDLNVKISSSLGAYYEQGAICSKFYPLGEIPDDVVLTKDLNDLIEIYLLLATKELITTTLNAEPDEVELDEEDLTCLREHKRIERNRKLADKAKKFLGYTCQACGFNFKAKYGDLGHNFIEAHHLTPIHQLKGHKITLNPAEDFAVLCSNCHKMIHKSNYVDKVNAFRRYHIQT